jgi:hypothetical protein
MSDKIERIPVLAFARVVGVEICRFGDIWLVRVSHSTGRA